jgi:hypothetical protein
MNDNRRWWLWIGLLALAALGLRVYGATESPFGDELILWQLIHGRCLGSMLSQVVQQEKTPPLGFVLSWLTAQLGPTDPWMRAPSVIAGTALVPLTALLARRAFNSTAGVIAAAFTAFSPFLVFYGSEARAYSLASAFTCASLVLLLKATDAETPKVSLWLCWAAVTVGAALSHYTAIPVLLVAVVWALVARPAARKALGISVAGAVVASIWWLPSFQIQWSHAGDEARRIASLAPLGLDSVWQVTSRAAIGSPIWTSIRSIGLTEVPGTAGLALIIGGLVAACVAAIASRTGGKPKDTTWLLAAAALAAPTALVLMSLRPHHSMLLPRNAITSVPAVMALAGGLFAKARSPKVVAVTAAVASLGLLLGSDAELRNFARPDMRSAADAINERWQPGDLILSANYFSGPPTDLTMHLGKREAAALQLTRTVGQKPFLDALRSGASVFTISPDIEATPDGIRPPPALAAAFTPVWRKTWHGMLNVTAIEWKLAKVK